MFKVSLGVFLALLAFHPFGCHMDRINPSKLTGHLFNAAKEIVNPTSSADENSGGSKSLLHRPNRSFFE